MHFKKSLLFLITLLLIVSISAVSAADLENENNVTYSDENISSDLGVSDVYESSSENISADDSLTDGQILPFTQLQALVGLSPVVILRDDYLYSGQDAATFNGLGIGIHDSLTIDGQGHFIDAAFHSMIFRINGANDVTFRNIIFRNAVTQDASCADNIIAGGAIRLLNSRLTLINCSFINNRAYGDGGAIYAGANSVVTAISCVFNGNSAAASGGAISATGNNVSVRYSTFRQNTATANGGAIICNNLVCEGGTFVRNTAAGNGGAVAADQFLVRYASFNNNRANRGGAVYSDNQRFSKFIETSFNSNNANQGGAICARNAEAIDSIFEANNADNFGGAIAANKFGMVRCTLEDNHAGNQGGGAYINTFIMTNFNRYEIDNCKFIHNVADQEGGGLFYATDPNEAANHEMIIANNYFDGNVAGVSGHHIYDSPIQETIKLQYNVFVNTPVGNIPALYLPPLSVVEYNWWESNIPDFWRDIIIFTEGGQRIQDTLNARVKLDAPLELNSGVDSLISVKFTDSNGLDLGNPLYGVEATFSSTTGHFYGKVTGINTVSSYYVHEGRRTANLVARVNDETLTKTTLVDMGTWMNIISDYGKYILATIAIGGIAATGYILFVHPGDNGDGSADNPAGTIQHAIDQAQDGDIIILYPGTYSGKGNVDLTIGKKVSIISPNYGDVIIDAEGKSNIFDVNVDHFNTYGIIYKNGRSFNGGAIGFNRDLSDSVINATFIDNVGNTGGAILFNKLSKNNTIQGIFLNDVANKANAIYFVESKDTLIIDSIFDNADAIYSNNPLNIESTWFGNIDPYSKPNVNAEMNNILFLNFTANPSSFIPEVKERMTLDLYSYDFNSNVVSKYYSKEISDTLDFELKSTNGSLSKNSVKLGEEFTFTPNSDSSRIEVWIGTSINSFDFSKEDVVSDSSENVLNEDIVYNGGSVMHYASDDNPAGVGENVTGHNHDLKAQSAIKAIGNNQAEKNSANGFWALILLIIAIAAVIVLDRNYNFFNR